jgi:phage gpG-like protein
MIALKFTLKDYETHKELNALGDRLSKPQEALREIGLYLLGSIAKNFRAGGRPVRWKPSGRVMKHGGQTLVKSAGLKNSIVMRVSGKALRLGTNKKYARIQHEGGKINKNVTVRKHWRRIKKVFGRSIKPKMIEVSTHDRKMNLTMPARQYLLIQDPSDWRVINRISEDYLLPPQKWGT